MQPVPAPVEPIEDLVAHDRGVRDTERTSGEGIRAGPGVAAGGAVGVDLAGPADPADQPRADHHCGAPVSPGEVVPEAASDDGAPVGEVQRGEPAAAQLLPVVVIDPGDAEIGAGDPETLAA